MLKAKTHKTLTFLTLGAVCLAGAYAATPVKTSGAIAGTIQNSLGIPQLGATVLLYNRQDRNVDRVLSDAAGHFKFVGLVPDHYSVKVFMAAFLPALRRDILVQPGMQSMLAVNLSSIFSTIQLSYPALENGGLMTDDWKWVLRTGSATRPVMRFADGPETTADGSTPVHAAVFSDTRGILRLSAGEGGMASGVANEADMGTTFALATSLFGSNTVQVSGNVGYGSQTGVPAAAFRTSYSRDMMGGSPQVSLTMRQLFLPGRFATAMSGSENALPMLRTMSASFDDKVRISDNMTVRYGVTQDMVTFLDRLDYVSPYARLTYDLGTGAELDVTFTSGNARPDLGAGPSDSADIENNLNALGMFPRISIRDAKTQIQRGDDYEVTYTRKAGSRTYSVSAYHDSVTNAALSLVGPAGLAGTDFLPDVFSGNSIFNAGNFQSTGYNGAITQNLGDHLTATMMFGSVGALSADSSGLATGSADELRSLIRVGRRNAATTRLAGALPLTGTRVVASYQWTADQRWAMPGDVYSTQEMHPMPGLNVSIRQPIPGFGKRVEATADLRNMLAQGYLPVGMVGGQRLMLVQTPRTVRGGLAIIF